MNDLKNYIKNTVGLDLVLEPLDTSLRDKLPLYLAEEYVWHKAVLGGKSCIFAEIENSGTLSIIQLENHFRQVRNISGLPVVAVFSFLEAYNRKRLIEKKIAFIVTGKQLYIPDLLISLKEYRDALPPQNRMTPVAQVIFLSHILYPEKSLESKTFKDLAPLLGTNRIGISRAVENLKSLHLVEVTGEKEKFIHFHRDRSELWKQALEQGLLVSPVQKKLFVHEKLPGIHLLKSNISALSEYTNIDPGQQMFYAIEKSLFHGLQKNKAFVSPNKWDGKYSLEVWKYSPEILTSKGVKQSGVVDPLSLYLSLKGSQNERIEMALEQIIAKYI